MSMHLKDREGGLSRVVEDILRKDATKIIWEEFASLMDIPGKGRNLSNLTKIKLQRQRKIRNLKKEF